MQKKLLTKFNTIYDKKSPESGHRGNLPQHNKGHILKIHRKYNFQWWKTESISSKIRNKTRMSTLATIIQHSFVVSFLIFKSSNHLSLFLCMAWGSILISFIYMQQSGFSNTTYWRNCLFPIGSSCLLCQRLLTIGEGLYFWVLYSVPFIHKTIHIELN